MKFIFVTNINKENYEKRNNYINDFYNCDAGIFYFGNCK